MIERRALLRGLFAMPAIVAVGSLMPIRGIIMPWDITSLRQQRIRALVRGLKEDGVWAKLDRLWVFDVGSEEEAMVDIISGELGRITAADLVLTSPVAVRLARALGHADRSHVRAEAVV